LNIEQNLTKVTRHCER